MTDAQKDTATLIFRILEKIKRHGELTETKLFKLLNKSRVDPCKDIDFTDFVETIDYMVSFGVLNRFGLMTTVFGYRTLSINKNL